MCTPLKKLQKLLEEIKVNAKYYETVIKEIPEKMEMVFETSVTSRAKDKLDSFISPSDSRGNRDKAIYHIIKYFYFKVPDVFGDDFGWIKTIRRVVKDILMIKTERGYFSKTYLDECIRSKIFDGDKLDQDVVSDFQEMLEEKYPKLEPRGFTLEECYYMYYGLMKEIINKCQGMPYLITEDLIEIKLNAYIDNKKINFYKEIKLKD